jgi:CubicO group peptidase (beta-lactamase class C family)
MRPLAGLVLLLLVCTPLHAASRDDVPLDSGEAEAALAILVAEAAGKTPAAADWQRLLDSDGYRALHQREAAMKRAFSDEDFAQFLKAPATIAQAPQLAATLAAWKQRGLARSLALAHAYLPADTPIVARVRLMVKPRSNSFVFAGNQIFLYLDPSLTPAQFENTAAHELHHIGQSAACAATATETCGPVALARACVGSLGEGIAMLAAAGGPAVHPHAVSKPEDRARWDRDLQHVDRDRAAIERFYEDILDGKIADQEQAMAAAAPFWGQQGAWYTVGWSVAVAVERRFGRARLVADLCDGPALLEDYNRAASDGNAPKFAPALLARLRAPATVRRLDGSRIAAAEIDGTVTRLMQAAHVPGVAITLFNDGRVVYAKAYGQRDVKAPLPLTLDSVMTGASFTKVVFAHLVLQLHQAGKIDLDRPVYQYLKKPLPQYEDYKDLSKDSRWKKITARMLLSHTAGFPNWRVFNDDKKLNINFTPGSRFAYSGEGIQLLQLVIEEITQRPLAELMQERLFSPLGMTRTSLVWQSDYESDFANGYDEWTRSLGPQRRKNADAAGSLQTTPRDFAAFMQSIMQTKLLRKETIATMLTPQIAITSKHEFPTLRYEPTNANKAIALSYGLGWGLYTTPYGKAFFKEGHTDGFRNYTVMFANGTGIVIMTNSSNGEGIYKELLETLLKNAFTPIEWEGFTPYAELPPLPSPPPGLPTP